MIHTNDNKEKMKRGSEAMEVISVIIQTTEKIFGEKILNVFCILTSLFGSTICYCMGGYVIQLKAFFVLMCLDYATGVLKSVYIGNVSSKTGVRGVIKKAMMCIVVSAVAQTDAIFNVEFRNLILIFFCANEVISLLENASEVITIPQQYKDFINNIRKNTFSGKKE